MNCCSTVRHVPYNLLFSVSLSRACPNDNYVNKRILYGCDLPKSERIVIGPFTPVFESIWVDTNPNTQKVFSLVTNHPRVRVHEVPSDDLKEAGKCPQQEHSRRNTLLRLSGVTCAYCFIIAS